MDRIFKNGKVYSVDDKNTFYTALGIEEGKIAFLGSDDDVDSIDADEIVDLQGRTVLPGFIDSHIHLLNYAFVKCNYNMLKDTSIIKIIEKGKEIGRDLDEAADDKWIYGRGWNELNFTTGDKRFLTKHDLDKISLTRPILFIRVCGHIATVNTKALEIINGLVNVKEYEGQIDSENGILSEAAVKLCYNVMTEPSLEEIKDLIKYVLEELSHCGITSVQSDDFLSLPGRNAERIMQAYRELDSAGELTVKIREQPSFISYDDVKKFIDDGHRTGDGTDYYSVGPIKLYIDGSLGAKTALMNEPYEGEEANSGMMRHTLEELQDCVDYSYSHDMQILLHAIGDKASDVAMDAYEDAIKKYGQKPLRLGINHLQIVTKELFNRMDEYGILAYIQPVFVPSDKPVIEKLVGKDRAERSYMWKTMLNKGLVCCGGSDSPVESFNILQNIQCAVTRDALYEKTQGWHPEEKLTVEEAVRLFTIWNAYGAFEENKKGSLEIGKAADLIILDKDIFEVEPHDIASIKVIATIVDGKTVYEK
jgi:hypothetical protein